MRGHIHPGNQISHIGENTGANIPSYSAVSPVGTNGNKSIFRKGMNHPQLGPGRKYLHKL